MDEKLNKKDLPFYRRYPDLPLITSICSLICSLIALVIKIAS